MDKPLEIPIHLENAVRKLRNNDSLVERVWGVLQAYEELRDLELTQTPLPEVKDQADSVLATLENHRRAVATAARHGYFPPDTLEELEQMRQKWVIYREGLDLIQGRKTKQESLRWLTNALLDIFDIWALPQRKLAGFIEFAIPHGPGCPKPSRSSIQSAIKESNN